MGQLEDLKSTFQEEYSAAQILKQHQKTKSVTILLSKSLFALVDYIIYQEFQKLPKNHSERFRILEQKFPEIYLLVDRVWSSYIDAYNKPAQEKSIKMLEGVIDEIINQQKIPKDITKIS
mgnify:CR=1 FL=1|jgi:hypothetical protein